ncbi:MAG TPA: hypothetical protein PKD54_07190 [Pirellulaceae bacterium]|nr:hypothetical protein [Pirellulaceae bacterium]
MRRWLSQNWKATLTLALWSMGSIGTGWWHALHHEFGTDDACALQSHAKTAATGECNSAEHCQHETASLKRAPHRCHAQHSAHPLDECPVCSVFKRSADPPPCFIPPVSNAAVALREVPLNELPFLPPYTSRARGPPSGF